MKSVILSLSFLLAPTLPDVEAPLPPDEVTAPSAVLMGSSSACPAPRVVEDVVTTPPVKQAATLVLRLPVADLADNETVKVHADGKALALKAVSKVSPAEAPDLMSDYMFILSRRRCLIEDQQNRLPELEETRDRHARQMKADTRASQALLAKMEALQDSLDMVTEEEQAAVIEDMASLHEELLAADRTLRHTQDLLDKAQATLDETEQRIRALARRTEEICQEYDIRFKRVKSYADVTYRVMLDVDKTFGQTGQDRELEGDASITIGGKPRTLKFTWTLRGSS